jgi:hypothetical protein
MKVQSSKFKVQSSIRPKADRIRTKFNVQCLVMAALLVLVAVAPVFAYSVSDPMRIGVGARPLGMGKAYVAYAEEGETLFFNPAGLGQMKSVKLTSMYSSLVSDINYLMVGGIYPNAEGNSAVGVGLVSAGVADIDLYDADGTSLGSGSWNDNVLILAYGSDMGSFGGLLPGLKVGAALKYYSSGGSGSASVEAATGSGFNADLGLLFNPTPWSAFGVNAQNILGGVITRDTGIQENVESTTKVGLRINLLGDKETAIMAGDQILNLATDVDIPNSQAGAATAMHVGVEYWPVPALALRAGYDQDASASGLDSNLTAGIGLKMGGLEFDYAYHPYGEITDDTTHYFSLSYVGEEIKPVVQISEFIILGPEDKTVIYQDAVEVSGSLKNVDLKNAQVTVNGVAAPLDEQGNFKLDILVKNLGKKLLVVEAKDIKKGETIATLERRIVRLTSYTDVYDGYWAKMPIEQTGTVGLIEGYPDGTFRPEKALSRAELATLLVRATGLPLVETTKKSFKDVPADHWANAYINTAQAAGLIQGYPDGKFKPDRTITKAEGIVVLARVDNLSVENKAEIDPFEDVSKKHWAARYILAAKNSGLLEHVKYGQLGPKESLSRAEAVAMLSKTNFAGAKIKELMSWVTGFQKSPIETAPQTSVPGGQVATTF